MPGGPFQEHRIRAAPLVAAADTPDRGRVALHVAGHDADELAPRDAQEDPPRKGVLRAAV